MSNKKIVVVGTGAFGTALANQFVSNHPNTILYGIDLKEIKDINENHKNSKYFGKKLDVNLKATDDVSVFKGADIIVIVLPSHVISSVVREVIVPNMDRKAVFISASKGYDHINQITLVESISTHLSEELNGGVMKLSGPSFAIDVVRNRFTFFDLASKSLKEANKYAKLLSTESVRMHGTRKLFEVELNSMLKNPYAILMGIIDGLGYKENTRAAMFTQCIVEMQSIVHALGGDKSKVVSAAGIGDFFLTGTSKKSRNYSTGYELGKKNKVNKKILTTFATTEGLKVLDNIIIMLKKHDITAPILSMLYTITAKKKEPKMVLEQFFKDLD